MTPHLGAGALVPVESGFREVAESLSLFTPRWLDTNDIDIRTGVTVRRIDTTTGTVYVICAVGGRSLQAANYLAGRGIDAVSVAAGTDGWARSGRPTESGE